MWGRIIPKILIVWDFENGPVLDTYWLDVMCVLIGEENFLTSLDPVKGFVYLKRVDESLSVNSLIDLFLRLSDVFI